MSRPKLGRTEPLRLVFTPEEFQELLLKAAKAGKKQVRDWAREVLLGAKDGD